MFDDETLIRHMMEPAPGERGRPPLNQVSVENLKQALYARFGKIPIVCDHESVNEIVLSKVIEGFEHD